MSFLLLILHECKWMAAGNSNWPTALTLIFWLEVQAEGKCCHIIMITATCPQAAVASGGVCPVGYACPRGTKHPQQHPCPAGTWSNAVGAQNLSSCQRCPPGLYCNNTGLSQPSGICDIGMELNYMAQWKKVVVSCSEMSFIQYLHYQ